MKAIVAYVSLFALAVGARAQEKPQPIAFAKIVMTGRKVGAGYMTYLVSGCSSR